LFIAKFILEVPMQNLYVQDSITPSASALLPTTDPLLLTTAHPAAIASLPSLQAMTVADFVPAPSSSSPTAGQMNNWVADSPANNLTETTDAIDGLTGQILEMAVPDPDDFIRRQGDQLIDGNGQPFTFQGIAFGNENWIGGNVDPFELDHSAIDFQRVKDMGMNSVRFYLNYQWFESDSNPYQYKESGWRWLDQNIQWAKQNDISLILNMHSPQGGYQSQGNGDALWSNRENQNRLAALWRAIGDRYKNETTIAGYGLVNEPIPLGSKLAWQRLAQRLANTIRQVDSNHLLFVEGVIGIENFKGINYSGSANQKMIRINDPKTVYEFHFYSPYKFTHQQFTWGYNADGGKYPDNELIESPTDLTWYTGTYNNPRLGAGTTPWRFFTGEKYKVNDPKIKLAIPALIAENVGAGGQVAFDDLIIREFDPSGKLTRTFKQFNTDQAVGWNFWSQNGVGQQGVTTNGRNDNAALTISGTTADSNISNSDRPLLIKQGYSYQISGWMKGSNVSSAGSAQIRLDFLTTEQPLLVRNKAYLLSELQPYINWAETNQVPLYLGEFGAGRPTFLNNRGGLNWVKDVMDIAITNGLSFNYHAYHEDAFGLYPGYGNFVDPTTVNRPLQQLFISTLK
jgi:endoglucanase